MRILVTGGTGLLGSELQKIMPDALYLGKEDVDIRDRCAVRECFHKYQPDLVLHLAADVRTDGQDKQTTYDTNVMGTRNVAELSDKLIYISTEYVFDGERGNYREIDYPNPLQFYGFTKLLGEYEARRAVNSVVVRLVFKPRPYKHPLVPTGMKTSGDYVDKIAPLIKQVVDNFDRMPEIIHVGTGVKLLKDLASETKEVGDIDTNTLPIKIPLDASLDLTLWNNLKKD